jgi:hypothetical protein
VYEIVLYASKTQPVKAINSKALRCPRSSNLSFPSVCPNISGKFGVFNTGVGRKQEHKKYKVMTPPWLKNGEYINMTLT